MSLLKKILEATSDILIEREKEISLIIASLLSMGHVLMEGVPGIAKTLTAKTIASLFDLEFRRIQMTPDLLPSDILGAYVYDQRTGEFKLRKGPIFTNILLADEINRASPRTQSALLEAMQERQVTIEGNTFPLPNVFIVLASQMPVGTEGTYNLTPVLIDRFAYSYTTKLPDSEDQEIEIVLKSEVIEGLGNFKIINDINILEKAYEEISKIYVSDKILRYIARIVKFIRDREEAILSPSPR
ncbi:MAG: AAA family ATPase, partial [Sulfolobales archaeon]